MKKIFLAVCFTLLESAAVNAKITEISDRAAVPQPQTRVQAEAPKVQSMTSEALENFLEERIKAAVVEDAQKITTGSINAVRSPEAQKALEEQNKPEFQKIYEAAMARVIQRQGPSDIRLPQAAPQIAEQKKAWERPNFPVVEAVLPDSPEKVLIPAKEHIPYLLAKIDILPDGVVKIEETVTVVANGEKLRTGVHKRLPSSILLRDGTRQDISYTFVSASINGQPADYKIARGSSGFLLTPVREEALNPGVYTYRFTYLAHNLMGVYPDFDEFYWDVTGSSWDLVIGKTGATITYPQAGEPLGQVVLVGAPNGLSPAWGNIIRLTPVSFGYRSTRPLFVGEGFHIISSLPHGVIAAPSFGNLWFRKIEKHSDVVFSALALLMIVAGFLVSGSYVRRNVGQLRVTLKKTAPLLRFLYAGRYDIKSFGAFILELYKKNIIDIQQAGDTILLVKRTDQHKNLSICEQKALQAMFGPSEAVFNVNKNNLIKIRRASRFIEKEVRRDFGLFRLKLNSGYILFSLAMLFAGEICIALFAQNPEMLKVLIPGTLALTGGCLLFYVQSVRNLYNIAARAFGTALVLLTGTVMASTVSLPAVALIFCAVLAIFYFTSGYGKRSGLLKPYIDETAAQKEYLRRHKDSIMLGREIANRQANILVLDMENEFPADRKNEYYKLGTIIDMMRKLG